MKARRVIISALLVAFGIFGSAASANAGLWCENVDRVDEAADTGGAAGTACRTALGVVCAVVNKVNGGSGCLA